MGDYNRKESYIGKDASDIIVDTLVTHLNVNGKNIQSLSNGNINIIPHGTGNVSIGNFTFDADSTVGSGQDNYVLTYDHSSGTIGLEIVNSSITVQDEGSSLSTAATTINFVGSGVTASGTGATKTVTIGSYTHPNHSGEVTSTNDGAQVVTDNVIDEANLKVDNSATNDYVLTAKSSASGGLTWAYPTLAGYAVQVVSSMPSSPDSNTIYFVT